MVKIDKGVPMPEKATKSEPKWPVRNMEVGDSFMVKDEDLLGRNSEHNLRASVYMAARYHGMKCSVSKVEGGYRVWRIK